MNGVDNLGSLKLLLQKESREIDVEVNEGQTMIEVLKEAGLPIDGILIFDNGRPVPLDSEANTFDVLTIINVSSGG